MCGILAVVGGERPVDGARAVAALTTLRHRGPDDSGTWHDESCWLGSRRLAILDMSSRGHQPMVDDDSGAVIAYNGEIYNYLELRAELESAGISFESGCDTEVLLKTYLQWGRACLDRLNGMWAFAIWDPRTQTCFFARDRFGVKPFVYTLTQERLSIASEPKALLALYPELRRVDERTLYRFLALGHLHVSDRSVYDGIQVLQPGHAGSFEPGLREPAIWQYWQLDGREPSGEVREGEYVERFGELLGDAVKLRLRSDVPVGVTLSGGLDSTAILHDAATGLPDGSPLRAFTSVFDPVVGQKGGTDERAWAALAARPYPAVELEEVPIADRDWLPVLERVAWHLEAPTSSPAVAALWLISERAHRAGVKVLLEGQGGDELLGGYAHHAALALLARGPRALGELPSYARTQGGRSLLLWLLRERFPSLRNLNRRLRGTGSTLRSSFAERFADEDALHPPPPRDLGARLIADLTREILPALLHYGDAMTMAHSVEARQPLLDYRLVEFCVALPDAWKVANGQSKRVLREHLRAIGQRRIADRIDKVGFPTPIWRWLAADDGAAARRLLLDRDARILEFCSPRGVVALVDRTARDPSGGGEHLFRLVSTELWLRSCLE